MKNHLSLLAFCIALYVSVFGQTTDSLKNSISLQYHYQHFDKPATDWHVAGLEYGRKTKTATYLGRINFANRFQQNGWQAEAEADPVLSKKLYAYTGLSYSPHVPVFPEWRGGFSLFVNLPSAWEAEGGLRYLYFEKSTFIGTAGISKYLGLWLLNFRAFASFNNELADPSFFLTARRYFSNEKDYAWLQLGSGISPDETRNVQIGSNTSLSSKLILAGLRKTISGNFVGNLSGGWSRDEVTEGNFGNRLYGSIGVQQHF